MAKIPHTPAAYGLKAFNCPLCHVYAAQYWSDLYVKIWKQGAHGHSSIDYSELKGWKRSQCAHCKEMLTWHDEKIIVPEVANAPPASDDLPPDVKANYEEAAGIAAKSPRGAAALLRLAIQKLCRHLGEPGKDINTAIASLVAKGLPVRIQQALDTVRVVGNEAVHPGSMDLRDDPEMVGHLFTLLNAITDHMIAQPRQTAELFGKLPPSKLEQIEIRNKKALGDQGQAG